MTKPPRKVLAHAAARILAGILRVADRVLELVRTRLAGTTPHIRDWNDRLLVEAFGRAYRCLRSVREIAGRGEGDDAAVLTRALVALTFRYLWLAPESTSQTNVATDSPDASVMGNRTRDARARAARPQSTSTTTSPAASRHSDRALRTFAPRPRSSSAKASARCSKTGTLPSGLTATSGRSTNGSSSSSTPGSTAPHPTSLTTESPPRSPAHHTNPDDPGRLTLERLDEQVGVEALGLALVTFAALLDFSEPIVNHGLTAEVSALADEIVRERRRARGDE